MHIKRVNYYHREKIEHIIMDVTLVSEKRDEVKDEVDKFLRKHFANLEWNVERNLKSTTMMIYNFPCQPEFDTIVIKFWSTKMKIWNNQRYIISLWKGNEGVWVDRMGYSKDADWDNTKGYYRNPTDLLVELRRLLEMIFQRQILGY